MDEQGYFYYIHNNENKHIDLLKLYNACRNYCYRKRISFLADDFASWSVINKLESITRGNTEVGHIYDVKWLYTNFSRSKGNTNYFSKIDSNKYLRYKEYSMIFDSPEYRLEAIESLPKILFRPKREGIQSKIDLELVREGKKLKLTNKEISERYGYNYGSLIDFIYKSRKKGIEI